MDLIFRNRIWLDNEVMIQIFFCQFKWLTIWFEWKKINWSPLKKRLQMWKFMNIFEKALCGHFLLPVVLIDKKASNFLQKMDLKASLLLHCTVVVKRMSVLSAYMGNVFQAKMTSLSKLILFFCAKSSFNHYFWCIFSNSFLKVS